MLNKMIRISFVLLVLGSWLTPVFGQGGFFGAYNSIEVNTFFVPNNKRTNDIKIEDSKTYLNRRLRIISPNFCLNLSRIVGRRVELNLGVTFSIQKSYLTALKPISFNNSPENFVLMKDLIIFQRGINFETRRYLFGNLAPTGRYFAFQMSFNKSSFKKNQDFIYADYISWSAKSSLLNEIIKVENITSEDIVFHDKLFSINTYFAWGRNLLIGDNLLINYSLGLPVISFQFLNDVYNMDISNYFYNPYSSKITDYNLKSTLYKTHYLYNLCRVQLGLKYFFKN
jgi:hypothetical protein